eukprot:4788084-Prymnesium_polylepis.1
MIPCRLDESTRQNRRRVHAPRCRHASVGGPGRRRMQCVGGRGGRSGQAEMVRSWRRGYRRWLVLTRAACPGCRAVAGRRRRVRPAPLSWVPPRRSARPATETEKSSPYEIDVGGERHPALAGQPSGVSARRRRAAA